MQHSPDSEGPQYWACSLAMLLVTKRTSVCGSTSIVKLRASLGTVVAFSRLDAVDCIVPLHHDSPTAYCQSTASQSVMATFLASYSAIGSVLQHFAYLA